MNTAINTLCILILALTTIISTVNMNQNNEIEILKSRVLVLEETK